MRNNTYYKNGFTFQRISKQKARIAYNNGLTIVCLPNKANPYYIFDLSADLNIKQDENIGISEMFTKENSFDRVINSFEFYNCNNELGKYTAFYIPVCDVDRFTGEKPTAATLGTLKSYDYSYMEKRC